MSVIWRVSNLMLVFVFIFNYQGISQDSISKQTGYQKLYSEIQAQYKFDQDLVNGVLYENRYRNAIGHPFLFENIFYEGSLTVRGKEYKPIKLKYDIFEQRLVVLYEFNKEQLLFVPPSDFVASFNVNNKLFKHFQFPEQETEFYQVIAELPHLQCLYSWSKNRAESSHNRKFTSFEFFDSKRKQYIVLNNQLMRFRNNFSFIRNFPKEHRREIRQYLRTNDIKVHKDNDNAVKQAIQFCNNLIAPQE